MRRQREQEEAYTKTNKNPQLSGLFFRSKFDKPRKCGNLKGAEKENHLGQGGLDTTIKLQSTQTI